jgi:uncharacterized protein
MSNGEKVGVSLHKESINRGIKLLIDPDSVFWALVKEFDKDGSGKIFSLYHKFREKFDASMRDFRFNTDLNSVYINPTDKCNADCPYCYISASRRKNGKQMSNEQLLYILRKLDRYFNSKKGPHLKPIIIYHGSEPLLMKDMIFSSIEKFNKKFHFGIQTNAILLEKKDAEFLKSHKVSVGISFDSLDLKINNYTRKSLNGNNHDKAIQAMEWFNGYEGSNVITTITKYNVKSLPKLVRFLHEKRVPCVLLNPVRATRNSTLKLRPKEKVLTRYFMKAVEQAIGLSKKTGRRIIIGNFSNIALGIVAPRARRLTCDISPCGGGRYFFAITATGDMIPCGEFIGLEKFKGGNIFESSIEKAISSRPFQEIRSRIVEKIPECDVCIYRNICGAPCPAEVYSLTKDVNRKSPYCKFYKEIIRFAFKLIADDKIKYLFRKSTLKETGYEYKLNTWNQ